MRIVNINLLSGYKYSKPDLWFSSFRLLVGFFAGRFAAGRFSRKRERLANYREQVNVFSVGDRSIEIET